MGETSGFAFPELAPLSVPVARHIAEHQNKLNPPPRQTLTLTLSEEIERSAEHLRSSRSTLEQQIRTKRAITYGRMNPVIDTGISTQWMLDELAKTPHPVTRPTVHRWRGLGLIGYTAHDRPLPDHVAAVLIASMIDPRERGWLPGSGIVEGEPLWYCWRQDSPEAPVIPCPVPLPQNLPTSTLLWTPWPGAAWDKHWQSVGTIGAVRWASIKEIHGEFFWNISEGDLRRWDPSALPLAAGILESAPEVLHSIATITLLRLAAARLQPK